MEDGFYTHAVTIPQIKCYKCIKTIERILIAVPGIYKVKANIFLKKVKIWHDNQVSLSMIINVLHTHNFKCKNDTNTFIYGLLISLFTFTLVNIVNLITNIFYATIINFILVFFLFVFIIIKNKKILNANSDFFVLKGSIFSFLLAIFYLFKFMYKESNCFIELSIIIIVFVYFSRWLEFKIYVKNTKKYFNMQNNILYENEFNFEVVNTAKKINNQNNLVSKEINTFNCNKDLVQISSQLNTHESNTYKKQKVFFTNINQILIGDILLIHKNSFIPTDGYVYKGNALIDESNLTGEFKLQKKLTNQAVYAGTKSISDLYIKVTRMPQDTLLGRILTAVEQSNFNHQYENELFSNFITILDKLSILIFIFYLLFGFYYNLFTINFVLFVLENTLSVMVVFCPCTFTLAMPITFFIYNFKFLENYILIKNSNLLLNKIDYFLFDKTGTLTQGNLSVIRSIYYGDINYINSIIKSIEYNEEHPIGKCLFRHTENSSKINVLNKEYLSGKGIQAKLQYKEKVFNVKIGKYSFVIDNSLESINNNTEIEQYKSNNLNYITVFISINNTLSGEFYLNDTIKPEAIGLIEYLKSKSITTCLVTGDTEQSALQVNEILKLDYIKYNCTAQSKLNLVKQFKKSGKVAYLGDGINDSLAINESDLGITLSKLNNSNITLLTDNLKYLQVFLEMKNSFSKKVRINIYLSVIYNLVCIPLSSGVFNKYGLVIKPSVACYCMFISFVSVLANTLY